MKNQKKITLKTQLIAINCWNFAICNLNCWNFAICNSNCNSSN